MARSASYNVSGGRSQAAFPTGEGKSARRRLSLPRSVHGANHSSTCRHGGTEKLARILRHAARVFSEKGYEGASMRDISRSSGVPLAGLYYYCESKQKILYLIQLYAFRSILERLERRLAGVRDPADRLRVLVQNHLEYFLSHPVEMKVLTHEERALAEPLRREVAEIKRRYYALAREIFEELRRAERIRHINPRVAVLSLFGMMNWIYTWYNPKVDPSASRLAETMAGIFLEGVRNGNGSRSALREPNRNIAQAAGRLAGG
jgi:AcrR family transcriptional regulator